MDGTSQACPMVSGVCALILSASQDIYDLEGSERVEVIKECLIENTDDDGGHYYTGYYISNHYYTGYNEEEYGAGVINAYDAVQYALSEF